MTNTKDIAGMMCNVTTEFAEHMSREQRIALHYDIEGGICNVINPKAKKYKYDYTEDDPCYIEGDEYWGKPYGEKLAEGRGM